MNISKSLRVIGVAITITVASQAQVKDGHSQSVIKPSFIGLFVSQLDSTKSWYENKLGFKVMQYKKISPQLSFAMLEWNGIWIEMIQNPKVTQRKKFAETFPGAAGVDGFFKLGFQVDNIEALEAKLITKGVKFKYPMMTNDEFKMKLFIIEDPEGNLIQFYNTPLQK